MRVALMVLMLAMGSVAFAEEAAPQEGNKTVLLAFEKTRFKNGLIDAMKKKLEASGIKVALVEHSNRAFEAKAGDYDAIFITNSGVGSKVRPWVSAWIEENKAEKAKIILHTTQTRDWKVDIEGVDAVTSASSRNEIDRLAADYAARIEKLAGRK